MDDEERFVRMTLRLPKDLHAELAEVAETGLRSLTAEIVSRLTEAGDAAKARASLKEAREEIERLGHMLDSAQRQLSLREGELSVMRKREAQLKFELDDRPKFEDMNMKIEHLQARLHDSNALIEALRANIESKDGLVATLRAERSEMVQSNVNLVRLLGLYLRHAIEQVPRSENEESNFLMERIHRMAIALENGDLKGSMPPLREILQHGLETGALTMGPDGKAVPANEPKP